MLAVWSVHTYAHATWENNTRRREKYVSMVKQVLNLYNCSLLLLIKGRHEYLSCQVTHIGVESGLSVWIDIYSINTTYTTNYRAMYTDTPVPLHYRAIQVHHHFVYSSVRVKTQFAVGEPPIHAQQSLIDAQQWDLKKWNKNICHILKRLRFPDFLTIL